jgi:hypothetical protein
MEERRSFAEVLFEYVRPSLYSASQLSTRAGIPLETVKNWLEGRVRKPREWRDVVKLASTLHLSATEASRLLRAAGHPTIEELLERNGNAEGKALLSSWADAAQQPQPAPLPTKAVAVVDATTLAQAQQQLAAMPLDTIPEPVPLPAGSRMPFRSNPLFVGRRTDLLALASAIKGGETAAIGQLETAAATGMGGIGKTQLAIEFVHRYPFGSLLIAGDLRSHGLAIDTNLAARTNRIISHTSR